MDGDKAQGKVGDERPYGKETLESLMAPVLTAPQLKFCFSLPPKFARQNSLEIDIAIIHPYFSSNI